jgi:Ran GTPase-activating protein (RanGAP) involved in mRNA processing and transport
LKLIMKHKTPKLILKEGLFEKLKEFLNQHEYSTSINFEHFPENLFELSSLIQSNKKVFEYIRDWFENNKQIKTVHTAELQNINFLSLETNKNIEKLFTSCSQDDLRDYLVESIPKNKTLEYIGFYQNYFPNKQFFKDLIEKSQHIKEIDFFGTFFCFEDFQFIHQSLKNHKNILKLNLSSGRFLVPRLKSTNKKNRGSQCLFEILIGNDKIQEIYLNCCGLNSDDLRNLVDGLELNSSVKTLHLQSNSIKAGRYISYMEKLLANKNLTDLNLEDCKLQSAMNFVAEGLKRNQTLTHLNLSGNNLKKAAINFLVEGLMGNQTLKVLNLNSNSFGDPPMIEICKFLNKNKSLTSLGLMDNELSTSCKEIIDYLSNNNSLEFLSLSRNELEMKHFSNLKLNKTLKELNLNIVLIDDQGCLNLVDALNQLQSLETLNISDNSLSNVGLEILCSTLEKNNSLRNLNLNFNRYNDCSSIGKLLEVNSKLERLEIGLLEESFELDGFITFSKSLHSTSLMDLRISKISTELVPCICFILENNSTLKSLELGLDGSIKMPALISVFNSLSLNTSLERFKNIRTNDLFSKEIEESLKFNCTLKEFISESIGRLAFVLNNAQRKKFNHHRRFVTHFYQPVINIKTWDVRFDWK